MHVTVHLFTLMSANVVFRQWNPAGKNVSLTSCARFCADQFHCSSFLYHKFERRCCTNHELITPDKSGREGTPGLNYYTTSKGSECLKKGHNYSRLCDCCYRISLKARSWNGSQADCKKLGGSLFTVDDDGKHELMVQVGKQFAQFQPLFIGGYREQGRKHWTWTTGKRIKHFRWHEGEPSSTALFEENCIQYWHNNGQYLWDNALCWSLDRYLCQYIL